MAKFYLSNKAVTDLNDIWDYTLKTWSENQAEIYYSLLIDSCQELANKPAKGKSYEVVEKEVLGYKAGEHIIFYRIVSSKEIEVVRMLHGMMDLKNHL
jgi:toxin ParE1/3/4